MMIQDPKRSGENITTTAKAGAAVSIRKNQKEKPIRIPMRP